MQNNNSSFAILLLAIALICLCHTHNAAAAITPICDPEQQWTCNNRECIPLETLCDGIADCNDCSDEVACQHIKCPPYTFRCDYGACIGASRRCNGMPDCADGSDEGVEQCGGAKPRLTTLRPRVPACPQIVTARPTARGNTTRTTHKSGITTTTTTTRSVEMPLETTTLLMESTTTTAVPPTARTTTTTTVPPTARTTTTTSVPPTARATTTTTAMPITSTVPIPTTTTTTTPATPSPTTTLYTSTILPLPPTTPALPLSTSNEPPSVTTPTPARTTTTAATQTNIMSVPLIPNTTNRLPSWRNPRTKTETVAPVRPAMPQTWPNERPQDVCSNCPAVTVVITPPDTSEQQLPTPIAKLHSITAGYEDRNIPTVGAGAAAATDPRLSPATFRRQPLNTAEQAGGYAPTVFRDPLVAYTQNVQDTWRSSPKISMRATTTPRPIPTITTTTTTTTTTRRPPNWLTGWKNKAEREEASRRTAQAPPNTQTANEQYDWRSEAALHKTADNRGVQVASSSNMYPAPAPEPGLATEPRPAQPPAPPQTTTTTSATPTSIYSPSRPILSVNLGGGTSSYATPEYQPTLTADRTTASASERCNFGCATPKANVAPVAGAQPPHAYFHNSWTCVVPAHDPQLISKLYVHYRKYYVRPGEILTEGNWIEYSCREGYRLSGARRARCDRNGWTGPRPNCTKILYCTHAWIKPNDCCMWHGQRVSCMNIEPGTEVHIGCNSDSNKWRCDEQVTWKRMNSSLLSLSLRF